MSDKSKVTIPTLLAMKERGEKIACLTAYDWLFAKLLDLPGLDMILVGDSGSMVFAGHKNTLPITLEQMIYHAQVVSRGVERALLVTDMPFLSYQVSPEQAVENAGTIMKNSATEAVKIEGGEPMAETIRRLVDVGIPVMGHLGLTPQSIQKFGGYKLRGKNIEEATKIKNDAKILQEAGVFSMVLEKIPAALATEISLSLDIPTIGIGAGPGCDGQILVTHDMLGLFEEFKPKFVRQYTNLAQIIREGAEHYVDDVKSTSYPSNEESY